MHGIKPNCAGKRNSRIRPRDSTGICRRMGITRQRQWHLRDRRTRMRIRNSLLVCVSYRKAGCYRSRLVAVDGMYPSMPAGPYPTAAQQYNDPATQYQPYASAPPLNYGSSPTSDPHRTAAPTQEQSQPLMSNQASAIAHDTGKQPIHAQSQPTPSSPPQAYPSPYPPIPQETAPYPSQPPSNPAYQTIPQHETGPPFAAPSFPAFPDAPTQIVQPPIASSSDQPKEALLIEL